MQHGGKRQGAGRPPIDSEPMVTIGVSLSERHIGALDAMAARGDGSRSSVIRQLIDKAMRGLARQAKIARSKKT